ncbi:hypothetical protein MUN78_10110 [Leucobacter allii]|uniref:Uncharacterized protein n=1 Tax=Leucobacter allii TaxID=2932247 RepID=A0ABY4FJF9_9MICO|nr:hypothetical protein [Leucobacter allii]UOQ56057.1 hypothetical protein MUN78_10110 [Leucobacter allii]
MKEETEVARSYANIRMNIWSDEDWRNLSGAGKLLYITLLCHDTLSYAGVADWRPAKLAPLIDPRWTADDVRTAAAELSRAFFVVISEESEEILIRSFLKHDGLMKQPKMAQAMTSAFGSIASLELRQMLAFEVQKLHANSPDLPGWKATGIEAVLRHSAVDAQSITPTDTLRDTPSETPPGILSAAQPEGYSPSPTPTPTPIEKEPPISAGGSTKPKQPYSKAFLEFWEFGLKKDDKIAAWKAWEKMRKAGLLPDLEYLRKAVEQYVLNNPDRQFQKLPATWINAGSWENDYTPPQTGPKKERLR